MAAVPQAARQRSEAEAAQLRSMGVDPASGAPVDTQILQPTPPTIVVPPPAPPAPAPTGDRTAELEAALSAANGRASASAAKVAELETRLETINSNRTFLEQRVTELADQLSGLQTERDSNASAQAQVAPIAANLDESGPTKEQIDQFGESRDYVERVCRKVVAEIVKPLLTRLETYEKTAARVKEIDGVLPTMQRGAAAAEATGAQLREQEFVRQEIFPYFPDFDTVRKTPEWKAYMLQDVPGRGVKIGDQLQTARKMNDPVSIRTIIGTYYDRRVAKPSLDALTVPGKTGGEVAPTPAPAKMKSSEYQAKLRAFISKRLSKPDWEAYRQQWEAALASNNVEMDVEIR